LQVDRTTVSKSREGFECLRSGIGADFLPALHRHSRDSIVARRARKNGSAPARESIGLFNCACARLRLRTRGRDTRSTCEPSRLLKRVDSNSAAFLLTRAHARARVKCKWNNCSYESGECAAPPPPPPSIEQARRHVPFPLLFLPRKGKQLREFMRDVRDKSISIYRD
jgi:hypothetical protein